MTKDTKIKIGFVVLVVIVAAFVIIFNDNKPKSQAWERKNWQELKLSQKKAYLQSIKETKNKQWHDVRRTVKDLVKQQVQFPEELEFGDDCYYVVECMDVKSYSDGHALFTGEVIGKNAFGVEKRVTYLVKLQVRPKGIQVLAAEFE